MINGIKLKICGITSLVDAEAADAIGADYLGFIFYPKSPRHKPLAQYEAMKDRLPRPKRVAVCVEPKLSDLVLLATQNFDFYQVHINRGTPTELLMSWAQTVGKDKLWLAPRLAPEMEVDPEWLPWANTFLLDTFHAEKHGGTGLTGDWPKFKRHQETHADKQWILAGGLNPENIGKAVTATGAKFVDVNSGVEQSPGVKSPLKLKALVLALQSATKKNPPG